MGVWIAHGEGRYYNKFPLREKQKCLAYVDLNGEQTTEYPMNPNGSLRGITGICSHNGRHLAMMPHPERTTLAWQTPWMGHSFQREIADYQGFYPWLEMFRNAYRWCDDN